MELKAAALRGEPVPRDAAVRDVLALARSFRDSLQNLPSRVAPMIAVELRCDEGRLPAALVSAIQKHMSEHAAAVSVPDDFLVRK